MRRRTLLAALPALAMPRLPRAQGADPAAAYLAEAGVPGVAWAVLKAGGRLRGGAAGLADPATGEEMTPDHRLRIASVSKPLTAATVLTLAEAGRLSLRDRPLAPDGVLARLVPPVLPRGAARVADVTLDHLLTHTSGGWPPVFDPMFTRPALPLPLLVTETLASRPLTAPSGTVWAYSNFGYALPGLVIEAVTGQPYAQAVAGRLGMTVGDNGFAVAGDGAGSAPGEAAYVSAEMDPQALPMARLTAVGGWIAAAPVLARALAGIDGAGADIVPRAVPAMMARPWQAGAGYGRGLILNPAHGNRWHDGSLPGTTAFAVLVDGGDVMVALANGRTPDSLLAMETMLWTLYLDG